MVLLKILFLIHICTHYKFFFFFFFLTFAECSNLEGLENYINCSKDCGLNGRQFAPGCICTVLCDNSSPTNVTCRENLQWSENIDFLKKTCKSVTSSPPLSHRFTMSDTTHGNHTGIGKLSLIYIRI